jgi:hypothetical protein
MEAHKITYKIYRDNQLIKTFVNCDDDLAPFKYLLDNQSQSVNYALKYGGYKVEEIKNEKSTFWKPYF